jgi:hypothetical protein
MPELAGFPDNVQGFAQAIVALRDTYAPNVLLGYHLSDWGTGTDLLYNKPSDDVVPGLAQRAANFFNGLGANFDLVFAEFSDRDAGFKQKINGDGGASWWGPGDFARQVAFLSSFEAGVGKPIVLWQIPLGNTRMRAVNNTWDHFQDNKVEWLLDDPSGTHLAAYAQAGVVALLFGRGADGTTCACDADQDGVVNPDPINGNTGDSLNEDDDGGYFHRQVQSYYGSGALPLAPGSVR